jgi:site-specific recombinase XerC
MLMVESPKIGKRIHLSLTPEQIASLMALSKSVRDKAIISLFGDSGLRLSELASVSLDNIYWGSRLIKVVCKGNKEGTELLLKQWLLQYSPMVAISGALVNGK